jgi:hypothetical protein
MKGAIAVLGVIIVGAAAYFIAKGKTSPTPTSGKKPTGNSLGQQVQKQLATSLLTSSNLSAAGGLLTSILPGGGAAKVAPVAGNGSGFVTERDLGIQSAPAAPAPAPVASMDNSMVVNLDDEE